jgi:hypothetical protein
MCDGVAGFDWFAPFSVWIHAVVLLEVLYSEQNRMPKPRGSTRSSGSKRLFCRKSFILNKTCRQNHLYPSGRRKIAWIVEPPAALLRALG